MAADEYECLRGSVQDEWRRGHEEVRATTQSALFNASNIAIIIIMKAAPPSGIFCLSFRLSSPLMACQDGISVMSHIYTSDYDYVVK